MHPTASPTPDARHVHALLTRQQQLAQALEECLAEETRALREHQLDGLPPLLEQKLALLNELEQTEAQRRAWLPRQDSIDTAWRQCLATLPQGDELLTRWQDIATRLRACREQNDVNRRVLGMTQQTVGRLLHILRGQPPENPTYTPQGLDYGSSSSRGGTYA